MAPAASTSTDRDWIASIDASRVDEIAERFGTPLYAYSADVLRARCRAIAAAFPKTSVRYAMKANACPALLKIVRAEGIGIEAVSRWEVRLAREVGYRKREMIYSGNNPSNDELAAIHRSGVLVNLDALSAIDRFGKIAAGASVSLRMNLELGAGHHPHVITAGPASKFGLAAEDLPRALTIARARGLKVVGLQQHIGSGLFDPAVYLRAMDRLCELAPSVPELRIVDVGGGFGVPYGPDEHSVDLLPWGAAVQSRRRALERVLGRPVRLFIEPGRYLVAECGVLLTRVTTVKRTRDRVFVGVDTGMHHLIRPALYGSFHPIRAIRPRTGTPERCEIVGPICESGDILGAARTMVVPEEGDLLAVQVAGAYGMSMASQYNLRARPAEVLIDGASVQRARARDKYRDVVGKWET